MEAKPITLYSHSSRQYRKPSQPSTPKFSGLVDGFSNLIGFVDSNRLLELMASDGIGMIVPRTALAYHKRGADDGRETFLREFSGLVGNVLITGWFGWGMLKILGNRVNGYNPHGLPLDAHINAANLNAFNQLYQSALAEKLDAGQARKDFVKKVLGSLVSDNPQFMWAAQRESLEKIEDPEKRRQFLKANLTKILGEEAADAEIEKLGGTLTDNQLEALGKKLEARNGKLSPDACNELAQFFEPKGTVPDKPDCGTLKLDEAAEQRIQQFEKDPAYGDLAKKLKDKDYRQKMLQQARLSLYQDSKQGTETFVKLVNKKALDYGVTGTVHITEGQQRLSGFQSRKNVLRELKYYLEHYVDRATHESKGDVAVLENKLFGRAKSGFLHQLFPKAEDGLITAAVKHKHALTWIPLALSLGAAGLFTFYNQYITAQKHGGRMFFPGEGNLQALAGQQKSALLPPSAPPHHNFRPTAGFQQTPVSGGILA
jgi:hypothetical protein